MLQKEMCLRFIRFVLIFWIGFSSLAFAQMEECKASLSGVLHNKEHQALSGATVYIKELGKGVVTDKEGRYFFEKICSGTYTLIYQFIGYKRKEIQVSVLQDALNLNFELESDIIHLEEIAIRDTKIEEPTTQIVHILKAQDLEKTRGKSLGESLKDISGVNTLQTGPSISKPVIHGLHSNRILVLNNGIRQEGQQWGSEHAPEIDPFVATQLSVVKGANAVRYGADAIGGVIIVEPPALRKEGGFGGEMNLVGMSNGRGGIASATLEGGFDKVLGLGWRVQGTYKRLGDAQSPDYILSNSGLQEINFSGALGYQRDNFAVEVFYSRFSTELGILRAAHTGNLSDLERAIDSRDPWFIADFTYNINNPRQKISHDLVKFKAFYQLRNIGKLSLQYGGQFNSRREFDVRLGDDAIPRLFMELSTHTLDIAFEQNQQKNFQATLGINGLLQDNYNVPGTGIRPLIPQYRSTGIGVFWIERYIRSKFELEAGLRYDYRYLDVLRFDFFNNLLNPTFSFNNISGTLGLIYTINQSLSFRSNLASAWRPPNVAELFSEGLHHGTGAIEEGYEKLQTEKAYKWINTFAYSNIRQENEKGISLELSAYYNYIQNYIFLEPSEVRLTIRGAFPVFQYKQSNVNLGGVDASLKWNFSKKFSFNSKASIVRARDISRNSFLIFIPSDRFENALTYTVKKAGAFKNLYLSFSTLNVSRQFRSPEVFSVAEVKAAASDESIQIPEKGFDFVAAPKAYMLFNADFGYTLPFKNQNLVFGFSINNILNTAYREYMNRFRYYADDAGRNFTLRLKYSFSTNP